MSRRKKFVYLSDIFRFGRRGARPQNLISNTLHKCIARFSERESRCFLLVMAGNNVRNYRGA